jgi:hypothetical protein
MAGEGSLAGYALPWPILLKPDVGETAASYQQIVFRFYPLAIPFSYDGDIPVNVNFDPAIAKMIVMFSSLGYKIQPMALVYKASIRFGLFKCLREQHAHGSRMMLDFRLLPGAFEGKNSSGLIAARCPALGERSHTTCHQEETEQCGVSH